MKKFTKVASVVALAATLTACGKTKTVEKKVEWTDEEKTAWQEAVDIFNGKEYILK